MSLESRIKKLSNIIFNTEFEEIKQIYKDEELNYVLINFEKYPEVRYSDSMKKRIINEAKRKRISKTRLDYIQTLVKMNAEFSYQNFNTEIRNQVNKFLGLLGKRIEQPDLVRLIHLEHDYEADDIHCNVYGINKQISNDNEIYSFKTNFNFKEIWGFVNASKFDNLCDNLQMVDVMGECYPLIFNELFKLRSYKLVKTAINLKKNKSIIGEDLNLKNISIEIGEHDNWFYTVFDNKVN